MEIILVRHGETNWNLTGRLMGQQDIVLNEHGREQALELREKLADIGFDCCYSSPLLRAKETAEIICEGKCQIILDKRLMERYGGRMEGKILGNWSEYDDDETVETAEELLSRAKEFVEMLKNSGYERVLVVSHSGILKNVRHCILDLSDPVDYRAWRLGNGELEAFSIS